METKRQITAFPNDAIPRKIEAKIKGGPVLRRAALGDICNKPRIQTNALKKPINLLRRKENVSDFEKSTLLKGNIEDKHCGKENFGVKVKNEIAKKLEASVIAKVPLQLEEEKMESSETSMEVDVDELTEAFSSKLLNINDIDREDADNPQLVSAYAQDIYNHMWELEDRFKVQPNYLEGRKITSRMRSILIDWLVQIHLRFTLLQETLYLTVAIIDRYLQANRLITKDKLQLVGVTAMFIACKYEEVYIPEIADFALTTDKAVTTADIRTMEVQILNTLNFYISYPLPIHFLRRNSKAGKVDAVHHTLAKYLMELTLPENSFSHYKASLIAASSLYLSMQLIGGGCPWKEHMEYYSKYSEAQVIPVVYRMSDLVIRSATSKFQAVRSKYKSSRLMRISDLRELSPSSKLLRTYAEKIRKC